MEKFTRRLKSFYQETINNLTGGRRGLDDFLFPNTDADADSANFALDELIVQPHGVSFRKAGEQSAVRPYTAGTGQVYEVPRISEKTPISEMLRDAVIVGGEAFESLASRESRLFAQIMRQHTVAHNTTRWKKAIDVIRTGKFTPTGLQGQDIGLEIDFGRDAGLDTTYDFTAVGATMDKALFALYDAYRNQNGVGDELVVILGTDWLKAFEDDTDVQARIEANSANMLLSQNMMPPEFQNVSGLRYVAKYRPRGCVDAMWIMAYRPQGLFIPYSGATAVEFMPSDEAVIFNMGDTRYKVLRGVDILDDMGNARRAVGDIVFDSYREKDPVQQVLRSSARYAYIFGNVNHTARSTGTFAES